MLSISAPIKSAASQNYYLNLAQQRYYTSEFEPPGQWFGKGAKHLQLEGEVGERELRNLFRGFSADGKEALVQNAGRDDRTKGWDLTFSAPKSVSTLWALAPENVRPQIEKSHQAAAESALRDLEQRCGVARRGSAGKHQEAADMVFATFQHSASRAQDPQLHTHAVAINLTVREDGSTGSLHSRRIFENKMRAGKVYRDALAKELETRLGLRLEPEKIGFHVVGVPKDLCAKFSQRRQEVEAILAQLGAKGPIAAESAALASRQPKVLLPRDQMFANWHAVGDSFGWGRHEAQALIRTSQQQARQETKTTPSAQEVVASRTARKTGLDPTQKAQKETPRKARLESQPGRERLRDQRQQQQQQASKPEPSFELYPDMPESERQRGMRERGKTEFRRILSALPPERRESNEIARVREKITNTYGTSKKDLDQVFRECRQRAPFWKPRIEWRAVPAQAPWKPALRKPISIRHRPTFPLAPSARVRKATLPVLVAEVPRVALVQGREFRPRWWSILWKRDLVLGELRVQQRILAPNAPKWSPFHGRSLPAFRLTHRKSEWQPKQRQAVVEKVSEQTLHTMTRM